MFPIVGTDAVAAWLGLTRGKMNYLRRKGVLEIDRLQSGVYPGVPPLVVNSEKELGKLKEALRIYEKEKKIPKEDRKGFLEKVSRLEKFTESFRRGISNLSLSVSERDLNLMLRFGLSKVIDENMK